MYTPSFPIGILLPLNCTLSLILGVRYFLTDLLPLLRTPFFDSFLTNTSTSESHRSLQPFLSLFVPLLFFSRMSASPAIPAWAL